MRSRKTRPCAPSTWARGRRLEMLEVQDVHTYRGQNYVLQGVTLSVPDAACVTLLGRNGMGKTTLIRSLMGLTPPRSGRIQMDGVDLVGKEPFSIARLGLALVPQGRHGFPTLSVEENLTLAARAQPNGGGGHWSPKPRPQGLPPAHSRRPERGGRASGG